jgi:N-acetylmuramoyl-L-alanine amidase
MIVIHATAGASLDSAVEWMRNPKSKVSSHYCIGKDGTIVQLVKDTDSAWHAGASEWKGQKDLNKNSIGIELVNLNDGKDTYPNPQINALARLILDIQGRYKAVTNSRIVRHHQIAPGRKTDPGIQFPWLELGVLLEIL